MTPETVVITHYHWRCNLCSSPQSLTNGINNLEASKALAVFLSMNRLESQASLHSNHPMRYGITHGGVENKEILSPTITGYSPGRAAFKTVRVRPSTLGSKPHISTELSKQTASDILALRGFCDGFYWAGLSNSLQGLAHAIPAQEIAAFSRFEIRVLPNGTHARMDPPWSTRGWRTEQVCSSENSLSSDDPKGAYGLKRATIRESVHRSCLVMGWISSGRCDGLSAVFFVLPPLQPFGLTLES